jgi:hypothetical protein
MACGGCRRKREKASSKSSKLNAKTFKKATPIIPKETILKRQSICSTCAYSVRMNSGRAVNLRKCRAANGRTIINIVRDPHFKCPKKRF